METHITREPIQMPAWLTVSSKTVHYKQGKFLFLQNGVLDVIYVVKKGSVIVLHVNAKGRESKVVLVPEGGMVGEMEAIVGAQHVSYAARAHTDCEVLTLPVADFLRWIDTDFEACKQVAKRLAFKLYTTSSQSAQYTSFDAMGRLMAVLLSCEVGRIGYTRQELADSCSASVRTINRCVLRLTDAGHVTVKKGKIYISANQMEAIAAGLENRNEVDLG